MADFSGDPLPVVTSPTHRSIGRVASADMLQATVPVRAASGALRTLVSVTLAVDPGDILAVAGRIEVTNGETYTVGVGGEIRMWDATLPYTETWERISPYVSDNVQPARHHMPLACTAEWQVPSTWVPGTPMTLAMLVSAFSDSPSRTNAHVLTVEDGYGLLQVERWAPDPVVASTLARLEELETALAAQAFGLAALGSLTTGHTATLAAHDGRLLALENPPAMCSEP